MQSNGGQSSNGSIRGVIANFAFGSHGMTSSTGTASSSTIRVHKVSDPPTYSSRSNGFASQQHQQQVSEKLNVQEIAAKFNQAINLNQGSATSTTPRAPPRLPSYTASQTLGKVSAAGLQDSRLIKKNVFTPQNNSQQIQVNI